MVLLYGPASGFIGAYLLAPRRRADRQQPAVQALRLLLTAFTLAVLKEYPQATTMQEVFP